MMDRSEDPDDLSAVFVGLRRLHCFSQRALSQVSGVQESALSDYERGKKAPRSKTRERLAAAFGVSGSLLTELVALFRAIRLRPGASASPVGSVRVAPAFP